MLLRLGTRHCPWLEGFCYYAAPAGAPSLSSHSIFHSSRFAFAMSRIEAAVIFPIFISTASSPNTSRHIHSGRPQCFARQNDKLHSRSQRQLCEHRYRACRTVHGIKCRVRASSGLRLWLDLARSRLEQPWGLHSAHPR